jgi:hypothetical protein
VDGTAPIAVLIDESSRDNQAAWLLKVTSNPLAERGNLALPLAINEQAEIPPEIL